MVTLLFLFMACFSAGLFGSVSKAAAETRSLKIYFVHTGEKAEITFKRNGRYDPRGLKQLNYILRDWRRNESINMDPRLFDLVWTVYRKAGASGYIYVVSGYRSPETNAMLRSRSSGVAKESQHMRGKAMDFFIPGVPLKTLRDIGMKLQEGGVGYYPNSGSPFVHMDVAGVRSWPRMPREELVRLFPDGKTLHIPADGKPLPGYQLAMAEYKKRIESEEIMMADNKMTARSRPRGLLAMLFGGGGDEDEGDEDSSAPSNAQTAPVPQPSRPQPILTNPGSPLVAMASTAGQQPEIDAPVPQARPNVGSGDSLAVALYSSGGRNAAEEALQKVASNPAGQPDHNGTDGDYANLADYKVPVPTLLGPRGMKGDAEPLMTASIAPADVQPADDSGIHIPIPAGRPALADAMAATLPLKQQAEPATVEEAMLSPAAAEALAASQNQIVATPRDRPLEAPSEPMSTQASVTPQAKPTLPRPDVVAAEARADGRGAAKTQSGQQEIASLVPASASERAAGYGDVFDLPSGKAQMAGAHMQPVRGDRPGPSEAEAARRGLSGGTRLTRALLAQWALSKDHIDVPRKAGRLIKLPQQVEAAVAQPTEALAVGFNAKPDAIDPSRFGTLR
ncbi:DUF882 domain-containing protein [Allorhizobium sp. BGMRC 0089]|uniref:DUF882 domain-containing protein n=1 Tax=Allorhizobium sonneratiae TaxID=2934936 RepID=UPI0020334066|nr:DUF882 domain-containing protein [Allorhizobium sonneratiae]MCM2290881.1 DUF882 domain-containing protein [Allorhizobium sonneratiae]